MDKNVQLTGEGKLWLGEMGEVEGTVKVTVDTIADIRYDSGAVHAVELLWLCCAGTKMRCALFQLAGLRQAVFCAVR